jgi:hypothetical protein
MRDERQVLNANHQFAGETMFFEETRSCSGSLQAKGLLEIEGRGYLNRPAHLLGPDSAPSVHANGGSVNMVVNGGKVFSSESILEADELKIGLKQDSHGFVLPLNRL